MIEIEPTVSFLRILSGQLSLIGSEDTFNARLAIVAISQIDILADHFILHNQSGIDRTGLSLERDKISAQERMIGIARDVHDTHKHGALTRKTAQITGGQRPEEGEYGGSIGGMPIAGGPIAGGIPMLMIALDSGESVPVEQVIWLAVDYWEEKLRRIHL